MGSSWFGLFFALLFGFAFFTLLGASWGCLGPLLASFWVNLCSLGRVLGRLGLCLGALLCRLEASGCRLGAVLAPSWAPKTVQKSTQVAGQKFNSLYCAREMAPRPPKMAKTHPKMAPRAPQDDPKWPNSTPKRPKAIEEQSTKRPKTTNTTPHNTAQRR